MRRFSKTPTGAILSLVSGLWAQPSPFVICDEVGDQREPVVIYDPENGNFIVAWTDGRGSNSAIYAARVDTQGTILEPDGALLYSAGNDRVLPQMDIGDTCFLMACRGTYEGSNGLYVLSFRKDMSLISFVCWLDHYVSPKPQAAWVCFAPDTPPAPSLPFAFIIFYTSYIPHEGTDIPWIATISDQGELLGAGSMFNTFTRGWAAAWNGNKSFSLLDSQMDMAVIGLMNPCSGPGDTPFVIRDAYEVGNPDYFLWEFRSPKDKDLHIAQNGYVLASETGGGWWIPSLLPCSRIWVDFLDTSGLPTRPAPFFFGDTLTRDSRWPTVAYNHPFYMVAWQDSTPDSVQIRAAFFDTSQNYQGPEVLIRGYRETQPDLIACPSSAGKFLLVWAHWNGPPSFYDIYGMFLDTIETVEVGLGERSPHGVSPSVVIYPNPFSDETMISVPGLEGQAQVAVYDATGRKVKSFSMVGEQKLNPGPEGVYFVEIKATGLSETVKIVKTRR